MTDPATGLNIPDDDEQRRAAAEALAQLDAPSPAAVQVMAPSQVTPPPVDPASGAPLPPPVTPPVVTPPPVPVTEPIVTPPPAAPAAVAVMAPDASSDRLKPMAPNPLDVGDPPAAPQPTGNFEKDMAANVEWTRQLNDYKANVVKAHAEVKRQAASVESDRSAKIAEAEEEHNTKVAELRARNAKEREVQSQAINPRSREAR
jgi:hypothetical protein